MNENQNITNALNAYQAAILAHRDLGQRASEARQALHDLNDKVGDAEAEVYKTHTALVRAIVAEVAL